MTTQGSNQGKLAFIDGDITPASDTFKMMLMQSGFSFSPSTHGQYSDVSGSELAAGSGYTAGGVTLTGTTTAQDDTNNRASLTFSNAQWTASGGNLVASGAIIYDDTEANDVIIGYIDFGSDQTTLDGGVFTVANIAVYLS